MELPGEVVETDTIVTLYIYIYNRYMNRKEIEGYGACAG